MDDARIIARQSAAAGAVEVLAQRHEVMFADGTTLQLHPVQRHGVALLTHRAVELDKRLVLVDLARVLPRLDADTRAAPPRDRVGLVFMLCRLRYCTAAKCGEAVRTASTGAWQLVGDGWVWLDRPAQVDAEVLDLAQLATAAPPAAPSAVQPCRAGLAC